MVNSDNFQAKFAVLTMMTAFSFNWRKSIYTINTPLMALLTVMLDPVHGSWMALNTKSAGERSVTMAIFIMAANCSGIASGQIFQAHDAPRYQTAWSVTVALSCFAVVCSVLTNLQYWYLNRRNAKSGDVTFVYKP